MLGYQGEIEAWQSYELNSEEMHSGSIRQKQVLEVTARVMYTAGFTGIRGVLDLPNAWSVIPQTGE